LCNKNLNVLVSSNSPIESSVNVALILSGISLYLEQLKIDRWDKAPMNSVARKKTAMGQWVSVNTFLRGFSILRERYTEA
jgi:hypothetical protein